MTTTSEQASAKELYDEFLMTSIVPSFEPVEVASASGATIRGADGRQYLDAFSGISVTNVGHCHPTVVAAAQRQTERLVHCCTYMYYNPRAGELARELARITPGRLKKSFLCNSGAEAVEGAMRLAKRSTGRREVVALTHSFHGRTYAALSVTGNQGRKRGGGPFMPGVAFAPAPYPYRCGLGSRDEESCGERSAEALRDVLRAQTSGDVAAFIAEPLLGEGGLIVPPKNYFRLVKQILEEEGILLIIDEVQTGFGRTGRMFGVEHYGVEPDMMTMAKGIAAGFPLGAFIARDEVADSFQPGDHLSTFGGNPVSCAAALASLGVMDSQQLPHRAEELGKEIMSRLRNHEDKSDLVGDVRGLGLMIGVELVRDRGTKEPADREAREVRRLAREAGVLVGVGGTFGNVVRVQPPLTITSGDAHRIVDALQHALVQVESDRG